MNSDQLTEQELSKVEWNPIKNHDAIVIIKEKDGNYRGFMFKNGKFIQTRQADPGNVMQALIIHP